MLREKTIEMREMVSKYAEAVFDSKVSVGLYSWLDLE